jgi:PST family polysaccharide transporter
MVRFGANLTAFDFVNYFARNLDNVLIGRIWGPEQLGLYSRAYTLMMFPITNIRGPLSAVAFPALTRLKADPSAFRQYYLKLLTIVSLITMPIVGLLYSLTSSIISIALGKAWSATEPIFKILAIVAFIQTPYSLTGLVQLALGRGRRYLVIGATAAAIVCAGFIVGVAWGSVGVAWGYVIATYAMIVPMLEWSFRGTQIRVSDFFATIFPPAVATVAACVATAFAINVIQLVSDVESILLGTIVFATSYIIVICLNASCRRELTKAAKYGWQALTRCNIASNLH